MKLRTTLPSTKKDDLVSWSLMSLFSTNMVISEKERSGVESYFYPVKKASNILTSTLAAFLFSSHIIR